MAIVTDLFPCLQVLRRIHWQPREQVKAGVDEKVGAVHKDERGVRREARNYRVDLDTLHGDEECFFERSFSKLGEIILHLRPLIPARAMPGQDVIPAKPGARSLTYSRSNSWA